ncbi:asparagine synthase-related protein [Bacillus sp. WP8]|uniref:asparagine synthase-related protein n=1 Tax=Bacillus sp. WP8 TaxID=756828 RepID=UPI0037BF7033
MKDLFTDGVRREVVCDVGVCRFLCGGVDCSAISGIGGKEFEKIGKGGVDRYWIE